MKSLLRGALSLGLALGRPWQYISLLLLVLLLQGEISLALAPDINRILKQSAPWLQTVKSSLA